MTNLKLIAALLDYPTELTQQLCAEVCDGASHKVCGDATHKDGNDAGVDDEVRRFGRAWQDIPLTQWQAEYVRLFDGQGRACLNLFEHIHGTDRQRGEAMASLIDLYREHGLELTASEMPDHLPVFLEFLSTLGSKEAVQESLPPMLPVIEKIHESLQRADSPYSFLLVPILNIKP